MSRNLIKLLFGAGLATALIFPVGVTAGVARAEMSLPQNDHSQARDDANQQGRNEDYSKNRNYQQGMRDGQDDHKHNRDHSKKRHFKKDDDQKAYEAGYQSAFQGDRGGEREPH